MNKITIISWTKLVTWSRCLVTVMCNVIYRFDNKNVDTSTFVT